MCDYSDAYIVVKGTITVQTQSNWVIDAYDRNWILKNNAPFFNCISKINNVLNNNAEDLDVVMPMYNLIDYSKKLGIFQAIFSQTTRVTDKKLGSHKVHHVRNILGIS